MFFSKLAEHIRDLCGIVFDKELFTEHNVLVVLFKPADNDLVDKRLFLALLFN